MDFSWFDPMYLWLGAGGLSIVGLLAIAWFIPPLRNIAIAVGAAIAAASVIYNKGNRDRAKLEARRREEAVQKVQKKYNEINKRPDTVDSVAKRMRDGSF